MPWVAFLYICKDLAHACLLSTKRLCNTYQVPWSKLSGKEDLSCVHNIHNSIITQVVV